MKIPMQAVSFIIQIILNSSERARTEMLRAQGVSQSTLLDQEIGFVVRHMDIDDIQGAKLDENLEVLTFYC